MDKYKFNQFKYNINPETLEKLKNVNVDDLTKNITHHTHQIPKINIPTKQDPKPKVGVEGLYERHAGKITIVLAIIALIQGIIIFLLSK